MPEPPAPPPAPDLDAIEARAAAATSGPWAWDESDQEWRGYIGHYSLYELTPDTQDSVPVLIPAPVNAYGNEIPPGIMAVIGVTPEDRDFISAARTDVPALVAYARALETQLAACWKLLKQMGEMGEQAVTLAERATTPPPLRLRELAAENARLRDALAATVQGLAPIAARDSFAPDVPYEYHYEHAQAVAAYHAARALLTAP